MKKAKKGFTLVELLIVIGIIGILTAMGIIGGSEANNIAQATKIIEEFRTIGAAMNLFYADNRTAIEENENFAVSDIIDGLKAYTKTTENITEDTTTVVGKYTIDIEAVDGQWWLLYKLSQSGNNVKLNLILQNKAQSERLMASASTTDNFYQATGDEVCVRVR